jgi:hypothetical protein
MGAVDREVSASVAGPAARPARRRGSRDGGAGPPWRAISRLIVEAARPERRAIVRNDRPSARPREISSRSADESTRGERRRCWGPARELLAVTIIIPTDLGGPANPNDAAICRLLAAGPAPTTALAERLGVPERTVRHRLYRLRQAGRVVSGADGLHHR